MNRRRDPGGPGAFRLLPGVSAKRLAGVSHPRTPVGYLGEKNLGEKFR